LSHQDQWYDEYLSRTDSLIFIIYLPDTNQQIGMVGLDHIDHRNQSAEYGRMLIDQPQNRGKGYAVDATITMLSYAFEDLNLNRIYLRVYADNVNAIALYERCRFVREGIEREAVFMGGRYRDLFLMSILRSEHKT
jgi:diamine N-acetyltransferase